MAYRSEHADATCDAYIHGSLKFTLEQTSTVGTRLTISYSVKGRNDFDDRVRRYVETLIEKMNGDPQLMAEAERALVRVLGAESYRILNVPINDNRFIQQLSNGIVARFKASDAPLVRFVDAIKNVELNLLSEMHPMREQAVPVSEQRANLMILSEAVMRAKNLFEGKDGNPKINMDVQESLDNSAKLVVYGNGRSLTGLELKGLSHLLVKEGLLTYAKRPDLENLIIEKIPAPPEKIMAVGKAFRF